MVVILDFSVVAAATVAVGFAEETWKTTETVDALADTTVT